MTPLTVITLRSIPAVILAQIALTGLAAIFPAG